MGGRRTEAAPGQPGMKAAGEHCGAASCASAGWRSGLLKEPSTGESSQTVVPGDVLFCA